MNLWIRPNTNRKSIFAFGKEDTLNNAMTEPGELVQAIGKLRELDGRGIKDGRDVAVQHLVEEMADVIIIIVNLMEIYNVDRNSLNKWLNIKQSRQELRADEKLAQKDTGAEKNGD